jgi:hypothetical protein
LVESRYVLLSYLYITLLFKPFLMNTAFEEMGFESVTILFPPTRTRVKGILRLGFKPDGEVEISGERFIRYRLYAPTK